MLYFLYPRLRKLSGAERLILRLATYTTELGAPVTLVTHHFDSVCRPALGPQVHLVETGRRLNLTGNHYLNAPLEYLSGIQLLSLIPADARAITFFGPPSLPALAWRAQRRRDKIPLLYFCYEPPRFAYDDTREVTARMGAPGKIATPFFELYKRIDRAMVRRADALLANSAFGAERLRAAYGRAATVITHGADFAPPTPDAVAAVRARYALAGRRVLITVNFLHPRKRLDLFLRTVARVAAVQRDTAALVVGSGPEEAALDQLASELGLENVVRLTGFVPDDELPAYYAASDVYLHTARLESFGLSVLEASAAGLPVVSVNEGGPREIIAHGESGLLVEPTAEALAGSVVALLNDEPRRAAMGAAAARRVRARYDWAVGAREFLDVVGSLHTAPE